MTTKADLKKGLDAYQARARRAPARRPPALHYLMVDGHGDPNAAHYSTRRSSALPRRLHAQVASKQELGRDYVVMPLGGFGGPTT